MKGDEFEPGLGQKASEIQQGIDTLAHMLGGVDRGTAEALEICQLCRQPITGFRDYLSRREYQISRMCQVCQNEVWPEGGEEEEEEEEEEL